MKRLVLFALIVFCLQICRGQVQVVLSPPPKLQFFDNNGRPLAFGCVFSYQSQSATPLGTYTDFSGNTLNSNPVILNASGFAGGGSSGIWLQAGQAYTLKVVSFGGTNCASGATQYTVDGIGGGGSTATVVVPFSSSPTFVLSAQNQMLEMTLTGNAAANPLSAVGVTPPAFVIFQLTQDTVGSHTWAWPANTIGGAPIGLNPNQVTTQMFVWNGTDATAIGPAITGSGPQLSTGEVDAAGNITTTGTVAAQGTVTGSGFLSLCANAATSGTIELCKTDSIFWRNNANTADQGISEDANDVGQWGFAGGLVTTGTIPDIFLGGTTVGFPRLKRNSTAVNFRLGDDSGDAPITAASGGFSGDVKALSLGCNVITTKTAVYTLTQDDCMVQASVSGGGFTLSLPHLVVGKLWQITRTDSSANALTINGDSGNVNGVASLKVPPNITYLCHSDGTNSWCLISPGSNYPQAALLTTCGGGTCTFTFPVAYSAAPACICSEQGSGTCNVASTTTTTCNVNTSNNNTYVIAIGVL